MQAKNDNEISSTLTPQDRHYQVLTMTWRKWNPYTLLARMQYGTFTLENYLAVS